MDLDEHDQTRHRRLGRAISATVIALVVAACGGSSEPAATTATHAQSPTTTAGQSPTSDAADYLGATLTSAAAGEPGIVVQSVGTDSKSRLRRGDVIVAVDGTPVASPDELIRAVGTPKAGERFKLEVVRESRRFTLTEAASPTAYLGAQVKDDTGTVEGAAVVAVTPESPAAATELERGDVITAVDDTSVRTVDDLLGAISAHGPGDTVTLSVSRGSRELKMSATLTSRPSPSVD